MSDGWVQVTGRRSARRREGGLVSPSVTHPASLEADEAEVQRLFDKISREVNNVCANSDAFLRRLVSQLRHLSRARRIFLYALGCGSLQSDSMVLAKSCLYQWAVCVILVKLFKTDNVFIFDPVMTPVDDLVWKRLLEHEFDFGKHSVLLEDLDSDPDDGDSDDNLSTELSSDHTLLWMPHCEKFLYKAVLEGILADLSPLEVSRNLSEASDGHSSSPKAEGSVANKGPKLGSGEDPSQYEDQDDGSEDGPSYGHKHDRGDHSGASTYDESDTKNPPCFSLLSTTLVGNSICEYIADEFSFLADFRVSESCLLSFEPHHQSFNDTFVTTFSPIL